MEQAGPGGLAFICVQSVVVDDQDNLWILDPAAPKTKEIVKGGPKLVKVDLKTNRIAKTIPFGEEVALAKSYLNDVRIDTKTNTAFITDSGIGAIIVVDLASGKARRLLADHKSTKVEPGTITVDGKELIDMEKNKPPQFACDGIALDTKTGYLYYHPLTGHTLYRIKTADLMNEKLTKTELESKVENVAQTPLTDGMLEAPDGSIAFGSPVSMIRHRFGGHACVASATPDPALVIVLLSLLGLPLPSRRRRACPLRRPGRSRCRARRRRSPGRASAPCRTR